MFNPDEYTDPYSAEEIEYANKPSTPGGLMKRRGSFSPEDGDEDAAAAAAAAATAPPADDGAAAAAGDA